ncbi:hypothetical protein [Burkholderia lata]|uniref:hypothetical protein n=1 Tax=Burkholderia lata (strain ATCC 17760 / DSM 23089 / LMG 22485 / NCIMB 9086 / R18194 / 383) TaxID=482957 RepID=UPI001582A91D|nr:hypothetical protein [Burkholderia lata]
MKRVVDNWPAKRREMLWNSTVRGGAGSGDAPVLARLSDRCRDSKRRAFYPNAHMCGRTVHAPRRGDPVPEAPRKAVHFNGERGCVVCNVPISLHIAAFASDSKRSATRR